MLKIITKILLLLLTTIGLYAGDGLTQKHLLSVSPESSATDVSSDTTIEVVFDTPIVSKSVNKNTIKLTHVKGTTTLVGDKTLRFTPDEPLVKGTHEVKVEEVRLQKLEDGNAELKPKTSFQKLIYWLCSLLYDNPADCILCKIACAKEDTSIKTQKITYSFTVDDASPKVETITLSETNIELHEGNETTLTVTANYDDNTTQDISSEVEWSIADGTVASVTNGVLKALKEGNTTVEAKYEGKTSDVLTATIYTEINGYRLPPIPDETLNNATLLGIDVNDNGVRDDVERWIYQNYEEPIEIGIFMQSSRAYGMVIVDPSKALETMKYLDSATSCQFYWMDTNQYLSKKYEYILFTKKMRKIQFNTLIRHMAYERYNGKLSGGVYDLLPADIEKCEFDDSGILGEVK